MHFTFVDIFRKLREPGGCSSQWTVITWERPRRRWSWTHLHLESDQETHSEEEEDPREQRRMERRGDTDPEHQCQYGTESFNNYWKIFLSVPVIASLEYVNNTNVDAALLNSDFFLLISGVYKVLFHPFNLFSI